MKSKQASNLTQDMVSGLIKKLEQHHNLDLSRTTVQTIWEKYENNLVHFAIRDNQIVGCCVIWNDLNNKSQDFTYIELGTIWVNKQAISDQDKSSILEELGAKAKYMAEGRKMMAFCENIRLAKYFRNSPFFSFSKIANCQSCPQELMESIPQFQSWVPEDIKQNSEYTRLLYLEEESIITPWYLVYEQ